MKIHLPYASLGFMRAGASLSTVHLGPSQVPDTQTGSHGTSVNEFQRGRLFSGKHRQLTSVSVRSFHWEAQPGLRNCWLFFVNTALITDSYSLSVGYSVSSGNQRHWHQRGLSSNPFSTPLNGHVIVNKLLYFLQ